MESRADSKEVIEGDREAIHMCSIFLLIYALLQDVPIVATL